MLVAGKPGIFNWQYSLQTAPSTTPGVSVTPGSSVKGSYVALCSGANMAYDCQMLFLWVNAGNTATTIRDIIIDIGVDPAGAASYAQTHGIDNIWVPQAGAATQAGYLIYLPFRIPAGWSVGVRAQANNTSTVRVMATFYGRVERPEFLPQAQYVESLGNSGNGGTPVTCGSTATEGTWTLIGTTTRDTWAWILATGHNTGTTTTQMYFFDLGYSTNSGTTVIPIIVNLPHHNPGTSEVTSQFRDYWFANVPAGAEIYARGSASGTAETTEVMAYGFGG